MEFIVLAGGLGTRLRGAIGDFPKCMAPVNGKPFLHYIFTYLQEQGCTRVILSLGYKHEVITMWLKEYSWPFEISHVVEYEPLGTGGGIQLAMQEANDENVVVLNGDTMFKVNVKEQFAFHQQMNADTSLALKEMADFDRYGVVNVDDKNAITAFEEKQHKDEGLINGGVYIINRKAFLDKKLPEKFSFEKDYLEAFVNEGTFYGYKSDSYFIDIGIPQDYEQAREDFKTIFG
jgi:D-glycero-alpha-D-manno-heptose 1-phosphate guanylyltransferase